LVLARAGASTLGELAALGKPAVLVPYPYAADNHQALNAAEFAKDGAAAIVEDRELAAGRLRMVLAEVASPNRIAAMRAAAERLRESDPVATILARIAALTSRKTHA
jgi:UDP-N-acetylglucosamine--N-acetylmuramyl-(pentapeptide) pyrophosphoryl-undecaprenol N-acetylglucosamine transferase